MAQKIRLSITKTEQHTVLLSEADLRLLVNDDDTPLDELLDAIVDDNKHANVLTEQADDRNWFNTIDAEVDDAQTVTEPVPAAS